MTIYISGISNQLDRIIVHTGNIGKDWLNRAVAFIQPIPTFISNHPHATGILVVSQLVALVTAEKVFLFIEDALKSQEGIDLKQRILAERTVHLLFTSGLMAGINIALNAILKLNLSIYALTAMTTVNIAASILYREVKRAQLARQAHAMQFQLASAGNPAGQIERKPIEESQQASLSPLFSPRLAHSVPQEEEKGTTDNAGQPHPIKEEKPFIPPLDFSSITGTKSSPLSSKTPKTTPHSSSHATPLKLNTPTSLKNGETTPSRLQSTPLVDPSINPSSPSAQPLLEAQSSNPILPPQHKEEQKEEIGEETLKSPSPLSTPRSAPLSTPGSSGSEENHQAAPVLDEEAAQTPGMDQPALPITDTIAWSPRSDSSIDSTVSDVLLEAEVDAKSIATDDTTDMHDTAELKEMTDEYDLAQLVEINQPSQSHLIDGQVDSSISPLPVKNDNPMGDSICFDDLLQLLVNDSLPKDALDEKHSKNMLL